MTIGTEDAVRVARIHGELRFVTTSERVFDVVVHRTQEWFPATYGADRTRAVVIEARPGGRVYEDWGGDAGYLYGTVTLWDPPHTMSMRTRLSPGTTMDTDFLLTPDGDATVLTMSRTVVGPISDEQAAGIAHHGDLTRFETALRALIEAA